MKNAATQCAACEGTGRRGRGKCRACGATGHGKRGRDYQAADTHENKGRQLLRQYADDNGLSLVQLADRINDARCRAGRTVWRYPAQQLQKYLAGYYRPRLELAVDIAAATDDAVPITSWLG